MSAGVSMPTSKAVGQAGPGLRVLAWPGVPSAASAAEREAGRAPRKIRGVKNGATRRLSVLANGGCC